MVVAYFASLTMIGQPDSAAARAISYFPLTAPMAMPGRIAMGATTWWEPVGAVVLTLGPTAGARDRSRHHAGSATQWRPRSDGRALRARPAPADVPGPGCRWPCGSRACGSQPPWTVVRDAVGS